MVTWAKTIPHYCIVITTISYNNIERERGLGSSDRRSFFENIEREFHLGYNLLIGA